MTYKNGPNQIWKLTSLQKDTIVRAQIRNQERKQDRLSDRHIRGHHGHVAGSKPLVTCDLCLTERMVKAAYVSAS